MTELFQRISPIILVFSELIVLTQFRLSRPNRSVIQAWRSDKLLAVHCWDVI